MPKITALPPAAAITTDDLLPIVDSPGGVPVTQKATFAQLVTLLNTIYAPITGGLYVLKAGDTMTGLLQFSGTGHFGLRLNNLTTVERDAIGVGSAGMAIWNTTTSRFDMNIGGSWKNFVRLDGDTMTGALAVDRSGIITTSTDGVTLQNLTAATAGVPVQMSPRLRLRSNVWNTTTPATNTDDWFIESIPANGATPSGQLRFGKSLNGGATTYPMSIASNGAFSASTGMFSGNLSSSGGDFTIRSAGAMYWLSRTTLQSPSDGVLLLTNNALGDFGRLQFGGTTSAFPAIKRSTTILQARLADDSAFTTIQGTIQLAVNATAAAPPVTTHTIPLTDAAGQVYRVPCLV